jgi:hypothetical protein
MPIRLRHIAIALLAWPTLLLAAPAGDLYSARVPVTASGGAGLDAAFARALGEVLVKVAGDRRAASAAGGDAATIVRQYQPQADGQVRVQFDPAAVRARLDGAGLPVWTAARPVTLVVAPAPAAQAGATTVAPGATTAAMATVTAVATSDPLADVSIARGVPVVRAAPSAALAADRADADLLAQARAAGAALLLVAAPEPTLGTAVYRWTLVGPEAGQRATWTGDAAEGIHGLADRLARRYAPAPGALADIDVQVAGIPDFAAYLRLGEWLLATGIVEQWTIDGLTRDAVRYRLRVRGGPGQLREVLGAGGVLEPVAGEESAFLYRLASPP